MPCSFARKGRGLPSSAPTVKCKCARSVLGATSAQLWKFLAASTSPTRSSSTPLIRSKKANRYTLPNRAREMPDREALAQTRTSPRRHRDTESGLFMGIAVESSVFYSKRNHELDLLRDSVSPWWMLGDRVARSL